MSPEITKTTEHMLEVSRQLRSYKERFGSCEEPTDAHREIIQQIQEKPQVKKLTEEQISRFEPLLAEVLADFVEELEVPSWDIEEPTEFIFGKMLWLDWHLVEFVGQFGPAGAFFAGMVEKTSRRLIRELTLEEVLEELAEDRWPSFANCGEVDGGWPFCLANIAYVYYLAELKDMFEEESRQKVTYTPGIQHEVSRQVARLCFDPDNSVKPAIMRPFVVTDGANNTVASLPSDLAKEPHENILLSGEMSADVLKIIQERFQRGLKLLRQVTTHRLLRAIAGECAAQFHQGQSFIESRSLRFDGGMRGLAEAIGEPNPESGRVQHNLRRILQIGRWIEVHWADGSYVGGLWHENHLRDRETNQVCVEIDAAPFFVPTFAHRYKTPSRQVVPIIPLPPGLSDAHSRHQGPLAACQSELVLLLTDQRAQLVRYGGALIPCEERHRIANKYKLKPSIFEDYFEIWLQDTDTSPAMLERVDDERFILADNEIFGEARAFLLEGGKRSEEGRERQKNGEKKKRLKNKQLEDKE